MSSPAAGPRPLRPESTSEGSSTIIDKAFTILLAFNGDERVLTLSEIARACGLPKSTVHRVLGRLILHDAVERHGERYKLGLGLVQFGATSLAGLLRDVSLPYLTALRRWTGQRVELTVLRQADAVCLERLDDTPRSIQDIGLRVPAHRSAAGRVILAFSSDRSVPEEVMANVMSGDLEPRSAKDRFTDALRAVRERGVAREQDETAAGVSSVAAPIVPVNQANAAVSLVFPTGYQLPSTADLALKDATARIAAELRTYLVGEQRGRWLPPTQ